MTKQPQPGAVAQIGWECCRVTHLAAASATVVDPLHGGAAR
ncbi:MULTISPECIES: hypothetical protein [Amycolatopsis]|nr:MULTISPECIES: hypothetical protein [Amycolatopsis]